MIWADLHAHLVNPLGEVDAGGVHGQADKRLVPVGCGKDFNNRNDDNSICLQQASTTILQATVEQKHHKTYKNIWRIQQKDNLKGAYGFPLLYLQGGTSSRPEGKYKYSDSVLPQIKSKTEHLECISDPHLLSIDDKIVPDPEKMWLVIIRYKNQLNWTWYTLIQV